MGAVLVATSPAGADEPPTLPTTYEDCSPKNKYCVRVDAEAKKTIAFKRKPDGSYGQPTWTIDEWFRQVALSDDGRHLVVAHDGAGLVPTDDPDQVMLRFFRNGRRFASVTLGELMDVDDLRRTTSNYRWGWVARGLDKDGLLAVGTESGQTRWFDPTTGCGVKRDDDDTSSPSPSASTPASDRPASSCGCSLPAAPVEPRSWALCIFGALAALRHWRLLRR